MSIEKRGIAAWENSFKNAHCYFFASMKLLLNSCEISAQVYFPEKNTPPDQP